MKIDDKYEHKKLLWAAINKYVQSCGGDPGKHVYCNENRMSCVVEIEKLVYWTEKEPIGKS